MDKFEKFDFMRSGTIEAMIDHRQSPCHLKFTISTSAEPAEGHELSVEVTTSHVSFKSMFKAPYPNHANVTHAFDPQPDGQLTLGIGPTDTCDVPFWIR